MGKNMSLKIQKIHAYVDESGQDDVSRFFVVVAVVNSGEQTLIRDRLLAIERLAKTNTLKWHKTAHDRRMKYLTLAMEYKIAFGEVYVGRYEKPIPYFFPMVDLLERAILQSIHGQYQATVYVDGINKTVAKSLTHALRKRGLSLRMVKGRRDESEPLIRLADMWAGCLRSALLKEKESADCFQKARKIGYLKEF